MPSRTDTDASPTLRGPWVMLLALCLGFALSQAYRTVAAMMAPPLQAGLGLTPAQLGTFAATFHFAFGAMQVFMGVGMDLHGVRRTVLTAFPIAIAGAVVCAFAPGFPMLVLGQVLIGVGCAPAFLACTVFISRAFPSERFAAISGATLSLGGLGMLVTGTPLAWVVDSFSWRAGFGVLALASVGAWVGMYALVRETPPSGAATASAPRESLGQAMRGFGELLLLRHTLGIALLASVTYASFMALRGLWLGPMLTQQYGLSLVQTGNVALAVSLVSLVTPPLFGRVRAVGQGRRRWIVCLTLALAALFTLLGTLNSALATIALALVISVASGYIVLQYADVRASYPPHLTGRALAVFTMAMFLGIAVMQWITGLVATAAPGWGLDPFHAVHFCIAALLLVGAVGFVLLPSQVAER